jgi:Flp pilus assembly secretin CpaC
MFRTLILVITLLFGLNAHCETKERAPLFLEIGEQRTLPFSHLLRYSLNGSGIVHYVRLPGKDSILIKALKPGIATLYVLMNDQDSETHLIRVSAQKKRIYPDALLQALNGVKTSEVIDLGNHYLLRGEVASSEEARSIAYVKNHFAEFIIDETTRTDVDLERSSKSLQKILSRYPGTYLENTSGALAIHGGVATALAKESFIKEIHAIDPLVQIDLQNLKDSDPTLFFKVFLLEVKKELITSLGIEWPPSQPATLNLSASPLFSVDSIDLTLHALSQKGLIHVLSSPELVVKAPGQAELFAGGELPIRERSAYNESIIWKNVGLSLKLDVKEYGGEKVRLAVETEMSHMDPDLKNDDIPEIQTNRIKTLVDGTLGKPLLLSGLLQDELRTTTKGLSGLSSIPILGKLFSREDYQKARSEFVVILLPERAPPVHPMQKISADYPRGYLPLPRNYLSEEEKENLKASATYPWNAL